jgi:hypothetical protein
MPQVERSFGIADVYFDFVVFFDGLVNVIGLVLFLGLGSA